MPPRPPSTTRSAGLAVLLGVLLVTSSIAAGALTASPLAATGDQQSSRTAVTCATGTTATASSDGTDENLSLSTWTAPASTAGEFQTGADVREAIASGRLTPDHAGANRYDDDSIANGDVLVHRIQLNGSSRDLLDRLDEQDEGSPTENFRRLVHADNGIDLHYLGPTACPPRLALNASIENGAFRVVPDRDHDTLYVVVDVEELRFELGSSGPVADKWNWGHHAVSLP